MGFGYEWLAALEQALRNAGFLVERGYPSKNAVHLTRAVAAVNLTRVNLQNTSAAATVTVLVPRGYGLDRCQQMAEEAALVLSEQGGQWGFEGWSFDESISCFYVEVVGTVRFSLLNGTWLPETGYEVLIGEEAQRYVTDFQAQQAMDRRLIRPHGQAEPVGVTPGRDGWTIKLTQLLPSGQAEPEQAAEPFDLTVSRGGCSRVYRECCWSDYTTRETDAGTQVVRSGFALRREVTVQ